MDEVERLANEKALAMLTQNRLESIESKLLQHDTVLMVGNGHPPVRTEVRRLADEVHEFGAMKADVAQLLRMAAESRAAREKSAGWRSTIVKKAAETLTSALITGLLVWAAWSVKTYVETA